MKRKILLLSLTLFLTSVPKANADWPIPDHLGGGVFTSTAARTNTITVKTTKDEIDDDGKCSLREAVENATDNAQTHADCEAGSRIATDKIVLSDSKYKVSDQLNLTKGSYIIAGEGVDDTSIVSDAEDRIFYVGDGAKVTFENLTLSDGYGEAGGAISAVDATVKVENCVLEDNSAEYGGSAIYADNSKITISNTSIRNNDVAEGYWGGAVYADNASEVVIDSSLLSDNTNNISGGAIGILDDSTLVMVNSTISGNTAEYYGGGIFVFGASATISNSTLVDNVAGKLGGGIALVRSDLRFKSNILSNNSAGDSVRYSNCYGDGATSEGYNFFEDNDFDVCDIEFTSTDSTGDHDELELNDLDDNGGPTETHKLSSGSTAIDTGSCDSLADLDNDSSLDSLTADQRGFARDEACDIGAYEKSSITYDASEL